MIVLAVLAVLFFGYYELFIKSSVNSSGQAALIKNPAYNMTISQAAASFNESFVSYILYSIGANQLHNPPLSSDTPKISFYIGEDVYNAEIIKGNVLVKKGQIDNADIIIRTSKLEGAKMMQGKSYVIQSFADGNSKIEMVAGKATLFTKGYLGMYQSLTGKTS